MKKVFITIVFLMFCNILVLAETENVKSANDITESQVDENLSHKAKVEKVSAEAEKANAEAEKAIAYAEYIKNNAKPMIQEMEYFIENVKFPLVMLYQVKRNPLTTHDDRLRAYDMIEILENEREDMALRLMATKNGTACIIPADTLGLTMNAKQMQEYIAKAEKELKRLLKVVDSPYISFEERTKLHDECRRWRRYREIIQMRLDSINNSH